MYGRGCELEGECREREGGERERERDREAGGNHLS